MRIWRAYELGEPGDVLRLEEGDPPEPGPGEVAIDVEAVGLNFPDLLQLRGGYQVKPPMPFTPGGEIVGRRADTGERVVAQTGGGLTERIVAKEDRLLPVPDAMTAVQAACLPTNYCTTWFALHNRAKLAAGETMLVHAGAGGVGSSAVQLGQAAGARIFATAGGPVKKKVLEDLGVDLAIDYLAEDFVDVVKAATDGAGVDVIYDPVGGDVFDRSRKVIGWDGRILIIGFTSGRIADAPTNHILLKNYSVVGVHYGASVQRDPSSVRRHWDALLGVFAEGKIDPLVYDTFPLEDVPKALELLANRGSYGKLVITP
jgi:NADPH:quinone reductase